VPALAHFAARGGGVDDEVRFHNGSIQSG
jgi:hypothetical protein